MNWADYAIGGIVLVSAGISLWRGFVREALSMVALLLAFWVALRFGPGLAALLEPHIDQPSLRLIVAFAVLFVVTLLVGGLVNYLAAQLVKKSGLTGTDRMLGMLFGIGRGVAVVALLVLFAGLTPMPRDPWWKQSVFVPHAQQIALWIRDRLPPEVAENIVYE